MGKRPDWEHVGDVKIYREKPPKQSRFGWVWGLVGLFAVILLISQCSG